MSERRRLLGIFAHPDDESFGPGATLAKYAREGVDVHVCIVTDGAAGTWDPEAADESEHHDLAKVRRQELECACRELGATLHQLGYRDSGMEGAPDNKHPDSLYQADLDEVARDIVRLVREIRPHVIITHDPTGGYFHPDHIKVNHAVQRAWARMGDPDAYPALLAEGYEPWQPARLYYTVIPRSRIKWFIRILRLRGQDPRRFGRNGDIDLTRLGVPDDQIHVRLYVEPYLDVKERASACHRSQGGGGAARWLPRWLRRRSMRYDFYVQAQPPNAHPHDDLFANLPLELSA
nr:PIG-L family deacetylase [Ardenticatena sp.]